MMRISELLTLENIEKNERMYEEHFGYEPFKLSTWDPSRDFLHTHLLNKVELKQSDYIHYLYTYELDCDKISAVKKKLRIEPSKGFLITNSGTSSIALVTTILKELNTKRVLVISPTYYSALYNFTQLGIEIYELYINRSQNRYYLPKEKIVNSLDFVDAVWITNPIYNTSTYYTDTDINFIKEKILERNMLLICDECFASISGELTYQFGQYNNFISILDPMKQILVNGLKFSCIVFDKQYQGIFNQWSDILCGSLSYSTIQGIDFFCDNKFQILVDEIESQNIEVKRRVENIIKEYDIFNTDLYSQGHMQMCYVPSIPYEYFQETKNIHNFIYETGVSIISGDRFHFDPQNKFSFRINLARNCKKFDDALYRVLDYFIRI